MFAYKSASRTAEAFRIASKRSGAVAIALLLAGCAGNQTATVAEAQIATRVTQAHMETEDDGLPAQAPPPVRIRAEPDDPSEPYSRNYGGANPSSTIDAEPAPRPENPPVADDLPPAFRQKHLAEVHDQN